MTQSIIDVQTGEVRCGDASNQIVSCAIGSCIAVAAWDPLTKTGGIAHVMLPGKSPSTVTGAQRYRYAHDSITHLITSLEQNGADRNRFHIYIAGGGNVLGRADDTICICNIESVCRILAELGFTIMARSLGGNVRRRVRLDVANGTFLCAEGDGEDVVIAG